MRRTCNTTICAIHNSIRYLFPRSEVDSEFMIFYEALIKSLLFRNHQPFFCPSLASCPLTSCLTLPFSTYHLRRPFQRCIYLTLVFPLPSCLPFFLPSLTSFFSTGFLIILHLVSCKRRRCQPRVSSRSLNNRLLLRKDAFA